MDPFIFIYVFMQTFGVIFSFVRYAYSRMDDDSPGTPERSRYARLFILSIFAGPLALCILIYFIASPSIRSFYVDLRGPKAPKKLPGGRANTAGALSEPTDCGRLSLKDRRDSKRRSPPGIG